MAKTVSQWEWQAQSQPHDYVYAPKGNNTIHQQWFEPDFWEGKNAVVAVRIGRGKTYFIADSGRTMVLRRYLRGGMVRHLSNDKFFRQGLKNSRVFAEINLLDFLLNQGINVPRPIAGLVTVSGLTYRNAILIEAIPNSHDFHSVLCDTEIAENVWVNAGNMVKKMHCAGVYHHDLNIHNLLVDNDEQVWIIDFDRCEQRPLKKSAVKWQEANLARLKRSLSKEQARTPSYHFDDTQWAAFMAGYTQTPA